MELFKLMEAEDRRNKNCKSALRKRTAIQTSGALQLSFSFSNEPADDDEEDTLDNYAVTLRQVLDRKMAIYKVFYPFLPDEQIQGKVIQSLGLKAKCKPGGKSLDVQILPTNTLSVNPLMMKDYHSYFVQLLTKLDHTNSSMKLVYELNQSNKITNQQHRLVVSEIEKKTYMIDPEITLESTKEIDSQEETRHLVLTSPTLPLGEKNFNQHNMAKRNAPLKRKSKMTINSLADTGDNSSELDSIIVPAKIRKVANFGKGFVHSTPLQSLKRPRNDCPSESESSIGTVENFMLPPTPLRKSSRLAKRSAVKAPMELQKINCSPKNSSSSIVSAKNMMLPPTPLKKSLSRLAKSSCIKTPIELQEINCSPKISSSIDTEESIILPATPPVKSRTQQEKRYHMNTPAKFQEDNTSSRESSSLDSGEIVVLPPTPVRQSLPHQKKISPIKTPAKVQDINHSSKVASSINSEESLMLPPTPPRKYLTRQEQNYSMNTPATFQVVDSSSKESSSTDSGDIVVLPPTPVRQSLTRQIKKCPMKTPAKFQDVDHSSKGGSSINSKENLMLPPTPPRKSMPCQEKSCPTRTSPKFQEVDASSKVASSIDTEENIVLPPIPPRKYLIRQAKFSPLKTPPGSQEDATSGRVSIAMKPSAQSSRASEVTMKDSIFVTSKFLAATKHPQPKIKTGEPQLNVPPPSDCDMPSSTQSEDDFEIINEQEEEEDDLFGLPVDDYMSKVQEFLQSCREEKVPERMDPFE